jgi:putative transposase
LRQACFNRRQVPPYKKLAHPLKDTPEFRALPAKVAQGGLRQVGGDGRNFWQAHQAYTTSPAKFTGRPNLPPYKPQLTGRNRLVYTRPALSGPALKEGLMIPSQLPLPLETKQGPFGVPVVPPISGGKPCCDTIPSPPINN